MSSVPTDVVRDVSRALGRDGGTLAALLLLFSASAAGVEFKSSENLAAPVLACEPAEIRLVLAAENAASFTFAVRNGGGRTLNWKLESCPTWLKLDVREGSLDQKQSQKIRLDVDAKDLRPGLATEGVVTIGSDAGGRIEIAVSVEVLAAAAERVVVPPKVLPPPPPRPADGGNGSRPPRVSGDGIAVDAVDVMAGFGSRSNMFLGMGARAREVEFGVLWSFAGDEEDWGEAYVGYRKAWNEWYVGGGLTLDFAVSETDGNSNTFGAWYLHGGWQREVGNGRWGVDLRVSPAVMEYFEPIGVSVTYGW